MRSGIQYQPGLIAHADWSTDPAKRWLSVATRSDGSYRLAPTQLCPQPAGLLNWLRRQSPDQGVTLGFDFPVGLPIALAEPLGVATFRDVLRQLSTGAWPDFLTPASDIGEAKPTRPFFPSHQMPKGIVTRQGLADALGVATYDDLMRRCDRATTTRRATACLLFLVGGQQVGKAAIAGWKGLILPHCDDAAVALWPFDGPLHHLVAPGRTVLCETYPGEFSHPLGLNIGRGGRSKRRQSDRADVAPTLLNRAAEMDLILDPTLQRQIETGFGSSANGEDAFDSLIGLLGMISVVTGRQREGTPENDERVMFEGWILGHPC